MIRINLLPIRAAKKRELGRQWLVLFALMFIGSLVGNYFWWDHSQKTLSAIQARVTKYQQDLATLNKIIGEVKNIRAEKAEMEQKLGTLKKLRDGRTGPVRAMDELAQLLPEHVTLRAWEESGGKVTFTGWGASHEEIANFLKKLKTAQHFSDPQLKTARQSAEGRVDYVIVCAVNYSA